MLDYLFFWRSTKEISSLVGEVSLSQMPSGPTNCCPVSAVCCWPGSFSGEIGFPKIGKAIAFPVPQICLGSSLKQSDGLHLNALRLTGSGEEKKRLRICVSNPFRIVRYHIFSTVALEHWGAAAAIADFNSITGMTQQVLAWTPDTQSLPCGHWE